MTQTATANPNRRVYSLAWSSTQDFLLVGCAGGTGYEIYIYEYDPDTKTLVLRDVSNGDDDQLSCTWKPQSSSVFATGSRNNFTYIYTFDEITNTATEMASVDTGNDVHGLTWHPNGLFLVAVTAASVDNIRLYEYSPSNHQLTLHNTYTHNNPLYGAEWSPDGNYLAIVGDVANSIDTLIYKINTTAKTLTLKDSASHGASVHSASWSADSTQLITGGTAAGNIKIRHYSFSPDTETLSLQTSLNSTFGTIQSIAWAPHNRLFAAAGDRANSLTHETFSGYTFPEKCCIRKNIIQNTTGGSTVLASGISGLGATGAITSNVVHNSGRGYKFITLYSNANRADSMINYMH